MNLFAAKPKSAKPGKKEGKEVKADKKSIPTVPDCLKNRDYVGACVLLEHERHHKPTNLTLPWLAYSLWHLGQYNKALDVYNELLKKEDADQTHHLHAACCLYYMGKYTEAEEAANKGPATRLQNRLLFHISHKQNDEPKLMKFHQKITDAVEDQLSLASIHYLRSHFQEATDIYKRLLLEYRDYLALQVYVALCYYKLDYYDVSLEILQPYINSHKDSAIAMNLKACNHYKLYDGKAAEAELKPLMEMVQSSSLNFDNNLVKHNLVVFRNGDNAMQVLPPLLDVIPEARLNLVIFHLRRNEVAEANELVKDLEPTTPQEYILKGVVNASVGQASDSRDHLKLAQQFFQLVGASASECDTIPGRQCMACCFFLLKQFEDVLIYMNSIKPYCGNDPIFNYNHGIALAACEQFKEAEEALLLVVDERYRTEYCYLSWLARCFIMNGKPKEAWELYLRMESNTDSFAMLVLIANDCYKVGSFYYSAKAFDVLERLDTSPEYWEGKRGACCGVFQQVIAKKEKKEHLRDIINMLRSNAATPQAEQIARVMIKWANENGVPLNA